MNKPLVIWITSTICIGIFFISLLFGFYVGQTLTEYRGTFYMPNNLQKVSIIMTSQDETDVYYEALQIHKGISHYVINMLKVYSDNPMVSSYIDHYDIWKDYSNVEDDLYIYRDKWKTYK